MQSQIETTYVPGKAGPTRGGIRQQRGQAIVLVALMMMAMLAGAGLAIDAQLSFFYAGAAERAAAAGALSGVVFLPYSYTPAQASPPGSGNDATDRALTEVARNGFTNGLNATVTVSTVPRYSNRLQVTVKTNVPTVFMVLFGIGSTTVTQSATAEYLPPISLGQPGQQLGSTVSQLGTIGNYFFMRMEGWSSNRQEGDAFTPDPTGCGPPACDSVDVHQLSAQLGTDNVDPGLPSRGGYNYRIDVPQGSAAQIQVYNAAFAPDQGSAGTDYCENWDPTKRTAGQCSQGGSYSFHEFDSWGSYTNTAAYGTMVYTVYKVTNTFVRNTDVELTQMKVGALDARNWNQSSNQYRDPVTNASLTQTYDPTTGDATNLRIFHSWINVMNYTETAESGLVRMTGTPTTSLGPGEYRLRIDMINYNGTTVTGSQIAHKGLSVRVTNGGGSVACFACTLAGMDDMAIYTPFATTAGGAFALPLFQLAPDYAGQTIGVDIYDPGDISGAGNLTLNILDPSGAVATATSPGTVNIYNLYQNRSNCCGAASSLVVSQPQASILASTSTTHYYNGYWLHFVLPIPPNYNPGTDPNGWWWSIQYQTTQSVTASDTFTLAISLLGSPAHLLG